MSKVDYLARSHVCQSESYIAFDWRCKVHIDTAADNVIFLRFLYVRLLPFFCPLPRAGYRPAQRSRRLGPCSLLPTACGRLTTLAAVRLACPRTVLSCVSQVYEKTAATISSLFYYFSSLLQCWKLTYQISLLSRFKNKVYQSSNPE